ncbi:MAG: hypothetical protein R3B96_24370 [Pirellulaceae bacterium]
MGAGLMTFDTVPGWGLRPSGESAIGPTHGSVVIDEAGNIYTSALAGVFVFSPEARSCSRMSVTSTPASTTWRSVRKVIASSFTELATTRPKASKFDAHTGEIVLHLTYPEESGLGLKAFNPTAITIGHDDIFLSNGYATTTSSSTTAQAST